MDQAFVKQLILDEGTRLFVYDDATGQPVVPGYTLIGHPTAGIGRALDLHGLSAAEAQFLLDNDIAAIDQALRIFPWWQRLNATRQFVLVDMALNLGVRGLLSFKHMIAAISDSNYSLAASEMLASDWAIELPGRAHRLASVMRLGSLSA